jgi:hypothetical protein
MFAVLTKKTVRQSIQNISVLLFFLKSWILLIIYPFTFFWHRAALLNLVEELSEFYPNFIDLGHMYVCMYVCTAVNSRNFCLFEWPFVRTFVRIVVQLFVRLTVCPTDHLSDWPFVWLTICLTDHLSDWPFVRLTICPTDHLSDWPFVRLTDQCK